MKILEKDYIYINPPKGSFLGATITPVHGAGWLSKNFERYKAFELEYDDFRHVIAMENFLAPKIDPEGYYEDENYDCVFSKHDIKVLIDKLQNIYDNMEDYIITPEMDAKYEEYLKSLIYPEQCQVNYERQQQDIKLIIDKDEVE